MTMRLSCLALAHRCPPRSEEALKPTRTLLALCCYHENATQTLTRCERGRRWKVSTRQKSPKHQDQDSLAEARVGRRLAKCIVSFRTMPSCNLVYAVLSLGAHATSAPIKVRPQSNLDGLHCLACLNAMHFARRLKLRTCRGKHRA